MSVLRMLVPELAMGVPITIARESESTSRPSFNSALDPTAGSRLIEPVPRIPSADVSVSTAP